MIAVFSGEGPSQKVEKVEKVEKVTPSVKPKAFSHLLTGHSDLQKMPPCFPDVHAEGGRGQ